MQSRLARLDRANAMRARRGEKPVWEDASPMGKKLRLLAQIALRSFKEDTVSLVAEQVSDEIQPILRAGDSEEYVDARRRSQALKSWARQEFPLDSTDEGATYILLSNIVCANSAHAARGLPKSSRGQWSRADFVNHLMTVATSTSRATIRPPVWNKGQFWPVLRAAVEEGRNVVRRDLSTPDLDHEPSDDEALAAIKEAFVFIANEERIGLVPDAVRLENGRMSTEPSIRAWTNMGPLPRHSQTVQATLLTSRQRDERQLAEVARAMAEENPGTVWTTVTTTIGSYHKFLEQSELPSSWSYSSALSESASTPDMVVANYSWAKEQFETNIGDWRCDLALHLAFLISKVIPYVSWPQQGEAFKMGMKEVNLANHQAGIAFVRTLQWEEKHNGGVHAESIYFTQAAIVFLCWMHSDSPLRRQLQTSKSIGTAWTNKHGEFRSHAPPPPPAVAHSVAQETNVFHPSISFAWGSPIQNPTASSAVPRMALDSRFWTTWSCTTGGSKSDIFSARTHTVSST